LADGLTARGTKVDIVRVADGQACDRGNVIGELVNDSAASVAETSELLNRSDVAVIQHECGIYGGTDGDEVVDVMKALRVPVLVIAHSVPKKATAHQHSVLEEVFALADQVVVMSEVARQRLCEHFTVDPGKVTLIAHGAALPEAEAPRPAGRPTILTWGLLGPGKGIERVIDAMISLRNLPTKPRYLVAGRTHPKVLADQGEAYREGLFAQAGRLGVADSVSFDAVHRDSSALTELVHSAAVVVLPYDSREQVASGVLVDSIASGRPVVATAFPHAVEMLGSSGAGVVVDHDDPAALVEALRSMLTDPDIAGSMASRTRGPAPTTAWPVVAQAYAALAQRLVAARLALA
jgi:glycosyltransferase involved in cell wall biosynthesis